MAPRASRGGDGLRLSHAGAESRANGPRSRPRTEEGCEMAEVILFHHAHGLTSGVRDFAEQLRQAGHTVHVPDLYEGHVFGALEEGIAYARAAGFDTILGRGQL